MPHLLLRTPILYQDVSKTSGKPCILTPHKPSTVGPKNLSCCPCEFAIWPPSLAELRKGMPGTA